MILQRLATSIRKQDWFTVLIETLIVVFGVFIGIQLGNWNNARADRALGREYADRLTTDLQQDLEAAQTLTGYYAEVIDSIETADRLLALPDPDPRALVVAAYRASEFTNNPPSQATWDQIVSSGDVDLLPPAVIESGLSDYYRFQDGNEDTNARLQDTPYRRAVRSIIPLPLQLAIRDDCSDIVDNKQITIGFAEDCRLDVDDAVIAETADALLSSPDIRETLRYQYSMVAAVQVNNNGNIFLLETLLDALGTADGTP